MFEQHIFERQLLSGNKIQEFKVFCGKNMFYWKNMFCFSLSTGLGKEYHATLLCLENENCTGLCPAASSWGARNS